MYRSVVCTEASKQKPNLLEFAAVIVTESGTRATNGGSYKAIPLEVNAHSFEDRFRGDPRRAFSVQKSRSGLQKEDSDEQYAPKARPLAIDATAKSYY